MTHGNLELFLKKPLKHLGTKSLPDNLTTQFTGIYTLLESLSPSGSAEVVLPSLVLDKTSSRAMRAGGGLL